MPTKSTVDLPSLVERYDTLIARIRRVIFNENVGQKFSAEDKYQAVTDAIGDLEADLESCLSQGVSPLSNEVLRQGRQLVSLLREEWSPGDRTHEHIRQLARCMIDNYHETPVELLGNPMFLDCATEARAMLADVSGNQELPRLWTNSIVTHASAGVRTRFMRGAGRFNHFQTLFGTLSDLQAGFAIELTFLLFAYRRFLRDAQEL